MSKFFNVVLVVALLGALGFSIVAARGKVNWGIWSRSTQTEVVKSVEFSQDITLMRLGVAEVDSEENFAKLNNIELPGTSKEIYLKFTCKLQLGIDGQDVKITKIGDNSYRIAIPKFKSLGISEPDVDTILDQSGALSLFTKDVDRDELENEMMNNLATDTYIEENRAALEMQAQTFYTSIVHGVDPDVTLQFTFAD